MEASPEQLLAYLSRGSRGWQKFSCDEECQQSEICRLRGARSQDNCQEPQRLVTMAMSRLGMSERDECGDSVVRHVLGALADKKALRRMVQGRCVLWASSMLLGGVAVTFVGLELHIA